MKITIDYELTEFTAEDAADHDHTRTLAMNAAATCYVAILDSIQRERAEIDRKLIEEQRWWMRFMHYCHTGRIV